MKELNRNDQGVARSSRWNLIWWCLSQWNGLETHRENAGRRQRAGDFSKVGAKY